MNRATFFVVSFLVYLSAAQPSNTLPPPCPLNTFSPGDEALAFILPLIGGNTLTLPVTDVALLPLIVFVVDEDDYGGMLLATDSEELDRFFTAEPPSRGTFLFLTKGNRPGAQSLLDIHHNRLHLQHQDKVQRWGERLAYSEYSIEELRESENALVTLLDSWRSPRLWAALDELPATPRVDASYECYTWPPIERSAWPVVGPFAACSPDGIGNIHIDEGSLLLVENVTTTCSGSDAAIWASKVAPRAAGVVINAPPTPLGRNCRDAEGGTSSFIPMLINADVSQARTSQTHSLSIGYSCASGTWLAVDCDGRLATIGWRKYNEASALRWALDHLTYLHHVAREASEAAQVIPLVPPRTAINNFSVDVVLSSRTLRGASHALLDFALACPGVGDDACGPWDRIISATAACWTDGKLKPNPVEIGRWITPFRRNSGRWLTPADVLVGLVGNGTIGAGDDALWICSVAVSTCCEQWLGTMDLLLYSSEAQLSPSPDMTELGRANAEALVPMKIPFATIPLQFQNTATHFGPGYNDGRTMNFKAPAGWRRASLIVVISGHGSDSPPPTAQGCEYAPTSHAFAIGLANNSRPQLVVNTSDVAYAQYMLAGSQLGCCDRVLDGVISGGHGDWRDGRNGWCPGQVVRPVVWDITEGLHGAYGDVFSISYQALSYYVDGSHASSSGCGGDIVFSGAIVFYSEQQLRTKSDANMIEQAQTSLESK